MAKQQGLQTWKFSKGCRYNRPVGDIRVMEDGQIVETLEEGKCQEMYGINRNVIRGVEIEDLEGYRNNRVVREDRLVENGDIVDCKNRKTLQGVSKLI